MWYQGTPETEITVIEEEISESLTQQRLANDFKTKCKNHSKGFALFGTVPPPKKLNMEKVLEIVEHVAASIRSIQPDGVAVYDIQDEASRNGEERPFPFSETHDPRMYAQLLKKLAPQSDPIIYRALVPNEDQNHLQRWLQETWDQFDGRNIVLVGGPSASTLKPHEQILTVPESTTIALSERNFFLGGIIIPERHRDRGNEHTRLVEKTQMGISFFTSQVVYNADNAIWLLRDYDDLCKEKGIHPVRIVFTFAPFGSDNTVQFLRWLGVELPHGTIRRVLSRPTLKARVDESLEVCWENWKRILDASKRLQIKVPIGFSVESVSKSRLEQDAAVELFSTLKAEMDSYYHS